MTWDRLSEAQWEATCQPCKVDDHEQCLLAVRIEGIPVPCACGCRDVRSDRHNRATNASSTPKNQSGGYVTPPSRATNNTDVTIPTPDDLEAHLHRGDE